MDCVLVLLQGLVAVVVFVLPGAALLGWLGRGRGGELPLAVRLAGGFVLSSLGMAAWQAASLAVLGPSASRIAAWALAAGAGVWCAWARLSGTRRAQRPVGPWERRSLMAVAALGVVWLLLMPLSPYPSHIAMHLGDPPAYCHAAANLVSGRGWQPDYVVADYVGGGLGYLQSHPIPVLATSFFFQVFGVNWHSLYVYGALAGALSVCLLAWMIRAVPGEHGGDGSHVLAITLAVAVVPAQFVLFGLGVVTAPGVLALLTLAALSVAVPGGGRARGVLMWACVLMMLGVRPEAALAGALVAVAMAVGYGFRRLARTRTRRVAGAALCGLAAVGLWLAGPAIAKHLPAHWRNLSVFYLRYDAAGAQFVSVHEPPWMLNKRFAEAFLSGEDPHAALANPAIASLVARHPVAFARHLAVPLPQFAAFVVEGLTLPGDLWPIVPRLPSLVVLGILLVGAGLNRGAGAVVGALAVYVFILPAFNAAAHLRHLLMVSCVLMGLAGRAAWLRWGGACRRLFGARRWAPALATVALVALATFDLWCLVFVRTCAAHQSYVGILRDIERVVPPGSSIATSYPQLITCVTGRPSVGSTWLTEHIGPIVKRFRPDFVLVDNARDGPPNYSLWVGSGLKLSGYEVVAWNPNQQYAILRAVRAAP